MESVYLAGPDVFLPNALAHASYLKGVCSMHGLKGVFPLDAELRFISESPFERGRMIYLANIKLIDNCDAVIANLSPFRGPSADVGTVYEIGYARGKHIPVVGYTGDMSFYHTRVQPDGMLVENFEMVDNLMVHAGVHSIVGSFEEAVERIARLLHGGSIPPPTDLVTPPGLEPGHVA